MSKTGKSLPPGHEEVLTIKEIAERLKVCPKTVRRLIKLHDIPTPRVGSQIRVPSRYLSLFVTKS